MHIPDGQVLTLEQALYRACLFGRVKFPHPGFNPAAHDVVGNADVCASEGENDRGRLFVHAGGGLVLFQWSNAGGRPGQRFSLQTGWAVVVVYDGPRSASLHLIGIA